MVKHKLKYVGLGAALLILLGASGPLGVYPEVDPISIHLSDMDSLAEWATQVSAPTTANRVLATPDGAPGAPTFRQLTAADVAGLPAGDPSFTSVTSGTNTTAAMVVGTGASISTSGSGTIAATTAAALAANGANCGAGQFAQGVSAAGAAEGCAAPAFSTVTGGTSTAAFVIGAGGSVTTSGGGTIAATTAGALAANPTNCSAGSYPAGIAADGTVENCTSAAPTFTSVTSGTNTTAAMLIGTGASLATSGSGTIAASTAAALAANGANCSAGQFAQGVSAAGAAEGCSVPPTATALAADGANCGAGQYAQGVDASGAAQGCSTPTEPVSTCASGYVRASDGVGGAACVPGATSDHAVLANRDDVSGHLWAVRKLTYAGDPNTGLACVVDDVYRLRVWNTDATPDEEWVCIAAGTPGTFIRASEAGGFPFVLEASHPSFAQVNASRCMPLTGTTSGEFNPDTGDGGYRFRPVDPNTNFRLTSLTMHYFDNNGTTFDNGDSFFLDFITCELVQADAVTRASDCTTQQRVRFEYNTVADGDGDGVYDCATSQVCRRTVPLNVNLPVGAADNHVFAVCFDPADAQFTLDDNDGGPAGTDSALQLLIKGFN